MMPHDAPRDLAPAARRPAPATPRSPATGADDPALAELHEGEEPVTTGTLFLTTILLFVIAAVWVVMYALLLDR